MTASVEPWNADQTVTWTSNNRYVATIDGYGTVTAVAAGTATITATTKSGGKTATCYVTVTTPITVTTTSEGTVLSGGSLAAKLDWLDRSAESHKTYILEVGADENIAPRTLQYSGAIDITVILRSSGANRTIRLSSNGTMFTVWQNVTLVLDNNITLQGHSQNTGRMVHVYNGIFKMNSGATITGNTGGGVEIRWGTFEMKGGTISGNTAFDGGGVYYCGTFEMKGGSISGNTASNNGGGVWSDVSTFDMSGGTISNN